MERRKETKGKVNPRVVIILAVVAGGGIMAFLFLRPGTAGGNALQQGIQNMPGLSTQEAPLVVRIDEVSYTKTANKQNFMPYSYRMRTGATYGGGPTVWWGNSQTVGTGSYGVIATETQLAQYLNFTTPAAEVLYCKNGSARIYWGSNLNSPTTLADILFKWNDKWCLGDQIPIAQIPLWIDAVINGHMTASYP